MIAIGSDHAGFTLKEDLKAFLQAGSIDCTDIGCPNDQPCDYPDYAHPVADGVAAGTYDRGILICGSGVGMSIAANRVRGVRAALCLDEAIARLSRHHNASNELVLAARFTQAEAARKILTVWMETPFDGGRHLRRIRKIDGGEP